MFFMKITDLNANPSDPNAKMTVGQDSRERDPNIAWLGVTSDGAVLSFITLGPKLGLPTLLSPNIRLEP